MSTKKPPPLVMSMTPREFTRAKSDWGEYSCSLPTGTKTGKRWLRNMTAFQPRVYGPRLPPNWWVGEFYELPDDDPHKYVGRDRREQIGIRWYRVLVVEAV